MTPQTAPPARRSILRGSTIFAVVLLIVFSLYTVGAFQLALESKRGSMGPGFVPRIIGVAAVVAIVLLLVRTIREERAGIRRPSAEGDAIPAAALGLAAVGLVLLFEPLGAVIAGGLFLAVCLAYLNPAQRRLNAVVAIATPVAMVALMSALDAPVPAGLLPSF